jgi:hypothetical protein
VVGYVREVVCVYVRSLVGRKRRGVVIVEE